jgi:hypothetical protein
MVVEVGFYESVDWDRSHQQSYLFPQGPLIAGVVVAEAPGALGLSPGVEADWAVQADLEEKEQAAWPPVAIV